ncbi:Beta-propeller repeat protein [compost metagenome]
MKKTTLLILFFYTSFYAQDSDWSWVKSFENVGSNSAINGCFMDNQKNIYHIGFFNSANLTIGETVIPNSSEVSTNPNIKYQDTYITKHDADGNLLFVKPFIGSKFEGFTSVAYDNNNSFYVTGFYNGSMTIGSQTYQSQNDEVKSFMAKLDLDGNVVWSKPLNYHGYAILKFKDNYLYLTGAHSGDTFTIDNITAPSAGYTAVVSYMDKTFTAKLDTSGNVVWLKSSTYNGSASINEPHRVGTQPRGLDIDSQGNVYVAGMFFCRSTTFGSITLNKSVTNNNANLFIAKYDSNGAVIWASSAPTGSSAHSTVTDLAIDSNNNIYLTGQVYNSQVNFGGTTLNFIGNQGSYLVKYTTTGTIIWAKAARMATDAQPNTSLGLNAFERLYIDNSNNIHVSGSFIKYINFGNNFVIENSNTNNNLFTVKYDSSGNPSDFYKITEAGNTREVEILDIAENDNVIYYSGKTSDNLLTLGDFTINNPIYTPLTFFGKRDKRLNVEEHAAKDFVVYPNPSQDQLYISGLDAAENLHFTVFDLTGKRIKSLDPITTDMISIDVKDLALGTYVLKIESGKTQKNIKFIKS